MLAADRRILLLTMCFPVSFLSIHPSIPSEAASMLRAVRYPLRIQATLLDALSTTPNVSLSSRRLQPLRFRVPEFPVTSASLVSSRDKLRTGFLRPARQASSPSVLRRPSVLTLPCSILKFQRIYSRVRNGSDRRRIDSGIRDTQTRRETIRLTGCRGSFEHEDSGDTGV